MQEKAPIGAWAVPPPSHSHLQRALSNPLVAPSTGAFQPCVAMKIAVIGQSLFGQEVYCQLRKEGHEVVGVFTIPDKDGKADPLGE